MNQFTVQSDRNTGGSLFSHKSVRADLRGLIVEIDRLSDFRTKGGIPIRIADLIDDAAIAQARTYFAFAAENLQLAKRAEETATVAAVSLWTPKLQVQSITAERLLRAKKLFAASWKDYGGL